MKKELLVYVNKEINQILQKKSYHFRQRNLQKAPDSDDLTRLEGSMCMSVINDSSVCTYSSCSAAQNSKMQTCRMNKSLLTASSQATFVQPDPCCIAGMLGNPFHQNFPCLSVPYSFTLAFSSSLSNSNHHTNMPHALGSLPSANFALIPCELLISRLDICAYKIQKPSVMMVDRGV